VRRLSLLFIILVSVLSSMAQDILDEAIVYERLMARKTQVGYLEGTPWTNDNEYVNTVGFFGFPAGYYSGLGCFGFMMDMMEYCSNYEYPIVKIGATYDNLPEIHVGDGVRIKNDLHSVVVLKVGDDGHTVTVVEGNYNYSVHWGRVIDLSNPAVGIVFIASFWPSVTTGISDMGDSPTRDITILSLSGTQLKSVPQTGLSVHELLIGLPKGYYIVKEGSKTYKVLKRGH
jgi:hypothetical protein